MKVTSELNIEDFANDIGCQEEALSIIKAIDLAQGDWDFTLEVAKYFVEKLKGCKRLEDSYTDWLKEL